MKILLSNTAYGELYTNIFLNFHLKGLLDENNIPKHKDSIGGYVIFTDAETVETIKAHPNFKKLLSYVGIQIFILDFTNMPDRFEGRYSVLVQTLRLAVQRALEEKCEFVSQMVADLMVSSTYLDKIVGRLEEGYDAVFVNPLRSAFESVAPALESIEGAPTSEMLCNLGYTNLHPLWAFSHWTNPQFTKLPFSLLWGTPTGLLCRSFAITPIVFTPQESMKNITQVIDVEVPHLCKNPYWAENWDEAPIIGIEPVQCYYPPFSNNSSNIVTVGRWSKGLHHSQVDYLPRKLYYPNKETAKIPEAMETYSDRVVEAIVDVNRGMKVA